MVWIFARSRECCEMVSRLSSQCDSSPRHSVSRLMMSGPGKIDLDCETGPQTFRISSQSSGDKERMRDFDGVWPGVRCLQRVWPCVTVVTWRRDKADTWHSLLRSQLAASFLSDLRAHVSVTNLVKKAEAELSLDCNNISASQLPAHTDPCLSLLSNLSI